jgi:hypothetical protein
MIEFVYFSSKSPFYMSTLYASEKKEGISTIGENI